MDSELSPDNILFVTADSILPFVKKQTVECVGKKAENYCYVGEPMGRNTAPAILLSALIVFSWDPSGLILVMPSYHIIKNGLAFAEAVERSLAASRDGHLVTSGILPTRPETGHGYIKAGKLLEEVHTISSFEEKPIAEMAEEFLNRVNYFGSSHKSVHSLRHREVSHAEVQVSDKGSWCPESVGSMTDDLGLVIESFYGSVGDPHFKVV